MSDFVPFSYERKEVTVNTEEEMLIKAIGRKHGTYCTFCVKPGAGAWVDWREIEYETYIADDIPKAYRKHKTYDDAMMRLRRYHDINDLDSYNVERAKEKLADINGQIEDLMDAKLLLEDKLYG